MKRRWKWLLVIGAIIFGGLFFFRGETEQPVLEPTVAQPRTVAVVVATAGPQELVSRLEVVGNIRPARQVSIVPKIGGTVAEVFVEVGQRISAGDVLLELDAEELAAQVRLAEAAVEAAEATLQKLEAGVRPEELAQVEAAVAQAETSFRKAEADYRRMEELLDKGIITKDQWEGAYTAYELAKAQLESAHQQLALTVSGARSEDLASAQAGLKQAQANLEMAQLRLDYARITSPIDGLVAVRDVERGATVGPSLPVMTIVDMDQVIVHAQVTESQVNSLQPGQRVEVRLKALDDQSFPGRILTISPVADQMRSYPVRVEVDNSGHQLKPGMIADVTFTTQTHVAEIAVPTRALVTRGDEVFVYVVEDGRASSRPVVSGMETNGFVEIHQGLQPGDTVIVRGQNFLEDGSPVNIIGEE
ncbi:MAG: efflux RND transporter periplasmic adaptor subunit [Limnochordia bacterium]